jgi:S1-C subfamily serine protease
MPFVSGILVTLIALLIYRLVFPDPQPLSVRQVNEVVAQAMASATPPPAYSVGVYQVIRPSLVLIQTQGTNGKDKVEYGLGSGVIIDDAGDILTSNHVIANTKEIKLTFADGTESTAQVITSQPENDIALLKPDTLPSVIIPATLGNLNAMQVGDEAYAVGNPFGLYSSMSAGIISGFNRTFQPENSEFELKGLIQIDTAVNPGNSGGPLVNRYGQVIGIVTGIINPTGQDVFVGIGFAVPINTAGGALGSPLY